VEGLTNLAIAHGLDTMRLLTGYDMERLWSDHVNVAKILTNLGNALWQFRVCKKKTRIIGTGASNRGAPLCRPCRSGDTLTNLAMRMEV